MKYDIHLSDLDRKLKPCLLLVVFAALLVANVYAMKEIGLIDRLFILCSVLFYFRFSEALVLLRKEVELVAPAGFFIYLTRQFVYAVLKVISGKSIQIYLCAYLIQPVIALAVLLAVYYFMKKFLPHPLAWILGGRVADKPKSLKPVSGIR